MQKIRLSVATKGIKANTLVHVDDAVAEELIASGRAVAVGKPEADEPEPEKKAAKKP